MFEKEKKNSISVDKLKPDDSHNSRLFRSKSSRSHRRLVSPNRTIHASRIHKSKTSKDCLVIAFDKMRLEPMEVINWNVLSKEEHLENIAKLTECLKERNNMSKYKGHLKEHDFITIELLISMNSRENSIKDQDTHNKWVKQVRFFVRVARMGWRNALYLENAKPSQTNLVQRQLLRLFELW